MDEHRGVGPQLEDGFVRIANELYDAILLKLSSYRHIKIVITVIRKTYGYGKKEDDITISQLADITGIHRNHVGKTVRELEAAHILNPIKAGAHGLILGLNKHHSQWVEDGIKPRGQATKLVDDVEGNQISCAEQPKQLKEATKTVDFSNQNVAHNRQPQKTTPKDNPNTSTPLRAAEVKSWGDAFAEFWIVFAYKHGKHEAKESWGKLGAAAAREGADLPTLLATVLSAAKQEAARRPHMLAKGSTPKYAQGWLTDRRFEDESLQEWGRYSAEQQAVIDDYNAVMAETGWPAAVTSPCIPERAASISAFLGLGKKPGFWKAYFGYVAENVPDADTTGIDWLLRPDTYAKIREGVHRQKVGA
jgi:phage replication O-like protein O